MRSHQRVLGQILGEMRVRGQHRREPHQPRQLPAQELFEIHVMQTPAPPGVVEASSSGNPARSPPTSAAPRLQPWATPPSTSPPGPGGSRDLRIWCTPPSRSCLRDRTDDLRCAHLPRPSGDGTAEVAARVVMPGSAQSTVRTVRLVAVDRPRTRMYGWFRRPRGSVNDYAVPVTAI